MVSLWINSLLHLKIDALCSGQLNIAADCGVLHLIKCMFVEQLNEWRSRTSCVTSDGLTREFETRAEDI